MTTPLRRSKNPTPEQQKQINIDLIYGFRSANPDLDPNKWTDDAIIRHLENLNVNNALGGSYNPNYKKTLKRFRKLRKNRKYTRNQKRLRKHVRKNKRTLRYKKA